MLEHLLRDNIILNLGMWTCSWIQKKNTSNFGPQVILSFFCQWKQLALQCLRKSPSSVWKACDHLTSERWISILQIYPPVAVGVLQPGQMTLGCRKQDTLYPKRRHLMHQNVCKIFLIYQQKLIENEWQHIPKFIAQMWQIITPDCSDFIDMVHLLEILHLMY